MINGVVDGDGKKVFNTLSEIEQLSPEYDSILKDIIAYDIGNDFKLYK